MDVWSTIIYIVFLIEMPRRKPKKLAAPQPTWRATRRGQHACPNAAAAEGAILFLICEKT